MAPLSNTSMLLFTHTPSEIVKTWTPTYNSAGPLPPFKHLEIKLALNDSILETQTTMEENEKLEVPWKSSLRFWDTLEASIKSQLVDQPAFWIPEGEEIDFRRVQCDIKMTPGRGSSNQYEQKTKERKKFQRSSLPFSMPALAQNSSYEHPSSQDFASVSRPHRAARVTLRPANYYQW